MNETNHEAISQATLKQFSGSEQFYRHWLGSYFLLTEGAHHVQEHGLAWFLDVVFSSQCIARVHDAPFQVWNLRKHHETGAGTVTADDGNGNHLYTQELEFTDYPFSSFELYLVHTPGTGRVAMLPSEY